MLAAIYVLLDVPAHDDRPGAPRASRRCADLDRREIGALAPLLLLIVLFGFFPMPLLDVINPTVDDTLQHVGVQRPAPTAVDAGAGRSSQ